MTNTFHAAGIIATDLVRRETRNGVLTSFRLAAGRQGRGQIWIDVEAWGHQAGILNAYGQLNRGITITGRVCQHVWQDPNSNLRRQRFAVTATDFDFWPAKLTLDPGTGVDIPNHVIISGRIDSEPDHHQTNGRSHITFTLASGRANTKTGRIWLPVKTFGDATRTAHNLHKGQRLTASGRLAYQSQPDRQSPTRANGHHYLDITAIHPHSTTNTNQAPQDPRGGP